MGVKILKQILRYIIKYICRMPCYFVSNGVEMPMTNQTFDFIWNGFGMAKHKKTEKCQRCLV